MMLPSYHKIFTEFGFRRPSQERRLLLWGFVLPLAFDFKKFEDTEGTFIQIILLIMTLVFGGIYVLLEEQSFKFNPYTSKLRPIVLIWWLYIAISPLPIFIWDVNIEQYLKVLLPFVLFGVSLSVMCSIERRMIEPSVVFKMLLWAGLLGAIWRVIYAIGLTGLSVDTIRWQILHPSIPFLLGFGIAGYYLKRHLVLSSIALLMGLSIAILSVTRSYIITLFFIFLSVFLIEIRKFSLLTVIQKILSGRVIFHTFFILSIAVLMMIYFRPDIISVWTIRFTEHSALNGIDLTMVTRIAEFKGQLKLLTQNYLTLLIGNGIGNNYQLDYTTLTQLPFKVDQDMSWFSGHSTWVYTFFSSGLLLGAIFPLVLILGAKNGYNAATQQLRTINSACNITAFIVFMSYFGQSFTANLLHERYGALILGIVVGTMFIYNNREKEFKVETEKLIRIKSDRNFNKPSIF